MATASSPPPIDASGTVLVVPDPAPSTPAKRSIINADASDASPLRRLDGGSDSKEPAKKKPKLTEAEKEEKRKEKEAKEKERADKKAERDEKKRLRDQEKKKKDEEKKKKDEEKKKREEEKVKKEKAQLKLNNFFMKPTGSPSQQIASSKDVSVATETLPDAVSVPVSKTEPTEAEKSTSDYDRTFHPFFVKPNVTVAPANHFQKDDEYKKAIRRKLDEALSLPKPTGDAEAMDVDETVPRLREIIRDEVLQLLNIPPHKAARRGKLLSYSTKDILARINSPDDPSLPPLVPAISHKSYDATYYIRLLNRLPHKLLKFAEDVRPPYVGTYTRKPTDPALSRGRNPFKKALPRVNYDYDSEAEWVADDEGEELLSGDDEEDDEDSLSEDMEGFLDDENDLGVRRGGVGALVPSSSGLCWEDENGKPPRPDLEEMRMEALIEGLSTPINPFTDYWSAPEPAKALPAPSQTITTMDPPRRPLATSNRLQVPNASDGSKKPKPTVPADQLEEFKRAIEGSDMTKTGLVEVLKKRFPKIPKEAIKNTLGQVAERVGDRQDDKRWVLL